MPRSVLIIFIICAYFFALLLVSHFASRKADNATFFSGNRRIPWPLVAIAMICAPISGVTFISVPGMVLTKGYGYLQMCFGFVVGYFVIALVLIPIFYKNNIISIYGYLGKRFGSSCYKTGAWLFMISKILGTAVRFFVICTILQLLVFEPNGIPFPVTVLFTLALIWFYTVRGGVKAVIWTDLLKCTCLIISIVLCIIYLSGEQGVNILKLPQILGNHPTSKVFFFEDPSNALYFWKQFLAGIFMVVAMTGLDQDMMQHALSCRDAASSKKNMIVSSFMQLIVMCMFLFLGSLLVMYCTGHSLPIPEKSDNLFATVAFHEDLPLIVGILFIIGLVSSTYSSVGSALTSLTTSFTIDILNSGEQGLEKIASKYRKAIHSGIAIIIGCVILILYYISNQDAISAIYTLASYTYGPILGLFTFGIFSSRNINGFLIPFICILSPLICFVLQWWSKNYWDYEIGFELLLINAGLTILGLYGVSLLKYKDRVDPDNDFAV